MSFLGTIGAYTLGSWGLVRTTAATATTAALGCFDPTLWPRTVREVFVRQVYFTAVQAVPFISLIAVVTGVVVVVQAQVWLNRVGQTTLVGPVLVFIMVREVGPLLTNFVVIGRSGSAMTAELASMKVSGEVHVLDAQGLDPFVYLLLPRAAGRGVIRSVTALLLTSALVLLITY